MNRSWQLSHYVPALALFSPPSKYGGTTWVDRFCLLLDGISADVCYTRDQGP
jgi:hypothetical protein